MINHATVSCAALQIRILMGMLHASPWCYYPLTLQIMAPEFATLPKGEVMISGECDDKLMTGDLASGLYLHVWAHQQ